jgi:RES domain-containing protein
VTSVFRLVHSAFADQALSGEAARRYGGRWNPPGVAVVYVSQSRALAALETFVHLTLEARELRFVMFEISVPGDAKMLRYAGPATSWRHQRVSTATQRVGGEWHSEGAALGLAVPSVVMPQESNYLLNVSHPQFRRLRVSRPEPFAFDERLWKS